MTLSLNQNQEIALRCSINNDFASGIHFHATGTGKSWIALEILIAFTERYPQKNIIWICERKSILIEQFSEERLKRNGYYGKLQSYHILNFSENKQGDWYESINAGKYWNKPMLIIINRAFLTSGIKYKKIKIDIDLIIHDECHTIINKSSQEFYKHIMEKHTNIKCIGFTATPNTNFDPFKNILTSYAIYDAFQDGVIVPPIIKWFKSKDNITTLEIVKSIYQSITDLPYKKIIVWTGMIKSSLMQAELWSFVFKDFMICLDNSDMTSCKKYHTFQEFEDREENAILFCAGKHREGSDIKNLDCCVFLDFVQDRYAKTFIQCIGRVLRKDYQGKKTSGLIIDIKAKSSTRLIDKMNEYLNIPSHLFPWKYSCTLNKKTRIYINTLKLLARDEKSESEIENGGKKEDIKYTIKDLYAKIKRPLPDDPVYKERLEKEVQMIAEKDLIGYIMRALEILNMTTNIPHVTRGSCGSSLLCYLVGISHVDPVKHNIKFARFLNDYRDNLPDIDFDFPYNMRDEVFLKLQIKWPGKIARISNHVHFHEKSALREGLRKIGHKGFISKYEINNVVEKLPMEKKKELKKITKDLDGSFRCFMLHCGGIVYYPQGVPNDLKLKNNSTNNHSLSQITLNKHDVAKNKQFKIDILSSRGLAQLHEALNYKNINFEEYYNDTATRNIFINGDNIGITLAESPLMRKAFIKFKPNCIDDIALCLAVIRPAAKETRDQEENIDIENAFVFDDDAIQFINDALKCGDDLADKYRRGFTKGDPNTTEIIYDLLAKKPFLRFKLLNKLKNLRRYSFCKSHAYSYAQLVWQIAYVKAHHPGAFWKATLKHCESSYRKWVHFYEAKCNNIDHYDVLVREDTSVFSKNRMKQFKDLTPTEQLQKYGYWDMKNSDFFPGCYIYHNEQSIVIKGIIASSRIVSKGKKKTLILFTGYKPQKYCEIIIDYPKNFTGKIIGIQMTAKKNLSNSEILPIYKAYRYKFF